MLGVDAGLLCAASPPTTPACCPQGGRRAPVLPGCWSRWSTRSLALGINMPRHRLVERIGARVASLPASLRSRQDARDAEASTIPSATAALAHRGERHRGGRGARIQTYLSADLCVHADLANMVVVPLGSCLIAHAADPKGLGVFVRTVPLTRQQLGHDRTRGTARDRR